MSNTWNIIFFAQEWTSTWLHNYTKKYQEIPATEHVQYTCALTCKSDTEFSRLRLPVFVDQYNMPEGTERSDHLGVVEQR